MGDACSNCGADLRGEFCSACGQRRFRPQDRSLRHLFGEAVEALTDFDSRLWRSLRATVLQPGAIARDWIDGRRQRWVSPIRLFLLANVVYFLVPTLTDLSLPLKDQVSARVYREFDPQRCAQHDGASACGGGQYHTPLTEPLARRRLLEERQAAEEAGRVFSMHDFEGRYNRRAVDLGKLLVVLHAPFIALALALAARGRGRYFADHVVVALGMLAFLLMVVPLLRPLGAVIGMAPAGMHGMLRGFLGTALLGLVVVHWCLACRRVYAGAWWLAAVQGVAAFAAFVASSLLVYRAVQFALALWTM